MFFMSQQTLLFFSVDLSFNHLQSIDPHVFDYLSKLAYLYYLISFIHVFSPFTFVLRNLTYSELTTVPSSMFDSLLELQTMFFLCRDLLFFFYF